MSATFFACLKWFFYIGIAAWFVIIPLLPIYGALNPWPEATSAIEGSGVRGTLLMIGAGGYSESGMPYPSNSYTFWLFSIRLLEAFDASFFKISTARDASSIEFPPAIKHVGTGWMCSSRTLMETI